MKLERCIEGLSSLEYAMACKMGKPVVLEVLHNDRGRRPLGNKHGDCCVKALNQRYFFRCLRHMFIGPCHEKYQWLLEGTRTRFVRIDERRECWGIRDDVEVQKV